MFGPFGILFALVAARQQKVIEKTVVVVEKEAPGKEVIEGVVADSQEIEVKQIEEKKVVDDGSPKKCPRCSGLIKGTPSRCRYCGHLLFWNKKP